MIQKHSVLKSSENSGVLSNRVWHLYKGFNRKVSFFGDYVKVSVQQTKPNNWLAKKAKKKALIIRTKKNCKVKDGTFINFLENSLILLKKRLTPEGTEILGPIIRSFKKKKFLTSIPGVL
jgi:ribosomal protein L14